MKSKGFKKKLAFNKSTIANLDGAALERIQGGTRTSDTDPPTHCGGNTCNGEASCEGTCVATCENTCTISCLLTC